MATWTRKLSIRARLLFRMLGRLDPRVVRLRDPSEHLRRRMVIVAAAVGLVLAATATFAATRGDGGNTATIPEPTAKPVDISSDDPDLQSPSEPPPASIEPVEAKARRPANFYDPIYVFTDEPASRVGAYPMADPPGLVVNVEGIPEPVGDAPSMVGEDDRVRSVRRRSTPSGVRYVIGLTFAVRRIEIIHDGNVVIIAPIK